MHGHKKFEDHSYHIPKLFLEFFNHASPELYKESRKPFDEQELNLHCSALAPYATLSWMLKENFSWLRNAFDDFIVAISNYAKYLQNQRSITNHTSETPVRTVLTELPLWKPVDIEEFLSTDSNNLIESLEAPIRLLRDVFNYQSLKNEPFITFDASSELEMERFWETILLVDDSVTHEDRSAADIKQRVKFFDHCCTARHYYFLIKKCDESSCPICHLLRCLPDDFEQLHCLPDLVPGDDIYYKSFEELY
ncbi:39068_t:CDS:2, partial [Gigaspora margarita]